MSDAQTKQTIREGFIARQADREGKRLATRAAETTAAIAATVVETRMSAEDGLAFLRAGGEREQA
ncbi:hypothetical protein HFO56_03100 [Rhizobium laguerreae]|uniref:hypothetical protein n=1 Tax=Rhizobium laguerreae TaxID=1076926 RepID=UPI001C925F25|nr:hypothetical protein [Rhizobium laguerreae]MBY3151374.1 hypothetical protein [Rhizobium laguerreae]